LHPKSKRPICLSGIKDPITDTELTPKEISDVVRKLINQKIVEEFDMKGAKRLRACYDDFDFD
jgi:DNA-binding transcriptional regulator GbsR (MarR family)